MADYVDTFANRKTTLSELHQLAGLWSVKHGRLTSMLNVDGQQLALLKKHGAVVGEQGYMLEATISLLEPAMGYIVFGYRNEDSYWAAGIMLRRGALRGFLGRRVKRRGQPAEIAVESDVPILPISSDMDRSIEVSVAASYDSDTDGRRIDASFASAGCASVSPSGILQFSRHRLDGKVGLGALGRVAVDSWSLQNQAVVAAPDVQLEQI